MGLLTNLIDAELTKKRDERVAKLNAYAAMLGQPDDKVAPEKKNQYLQLLTGEAPKGGKDLLQMMGPHLLKMGGKSKAQQAAQQSQQSPGDADLVSPDPNAPKKPAASEGASSGPFRSTEEQEAMRDREEKRKNAQEIEKATKIHEAQERTKLAVDGLRRKQDQTDIESILKRKAAGELDEDAAQEEIINITKRSPIEYEYQQGGMELPNGQKIYGAVSKKKPNIVRISTPDGKQQDVVAPPMARVFTDTGKGAGTKKAVSITGPNGEEFIGFQGVDAEGRPQLYKQGSDEPLDPDKYQEKPKAAAGEMGAEEKSRLWAENHKNDPNPAVAKTAKDTLRHLDAVSQGANIRVDLGNLNLQDKREQEASIPDTVRGIKNGTIPPDRTALGRGGNWLKIQGELERQGFDVTKAELDWKAANRYISSVNSTQQIRLREAASTLGQMIPDVQKKYDEWQKAGPTSGIRIFNKASLEASKNLPGKAGEAARALDIQIADMVSELGQVYMGGNSPTDHALSLAQKNLQGDWNDAQFKAALKLLHTNLGYRINSINNAGAGGIRPDSPYMPQGGGGVPDSGPKTVNTKAEYDALPSGTIYLEDGKKYRKP